jgi:tRNA wybutosine-synthesizing protein 1
MVSQLTEKQIKNLEKQKYRIVGNHSAVKVCGWTKNKIVGKGGCYKEKFYGIKSHQCMQMTTSMFCANRCTFCWRGLKAPVAEKWFGDIDTPEFILSESIKNQKKLLQGFKGFKKSDKKFIKEMENVKHVALSLTGEPLTYPKINNLISLFHENNISTFLVTNGQYPEMLNNLADVTQLYVSLDAPNKEILKSLGNPVFSDYWERLNKSLTILSKKNSRTCLRMTLVNPDNMVEPENYARLITKSGADFVEVKSYMWVGENRKFFTLKSMPKSEEIRKFSLEILKNLSGYEIADEHLSSRVVLLAKKGMKRKIDFDKFFELYKKNKLRKEDYSY